MKSCRKIKRRCAQFSPAAITSTDEVASLREIANKSKQTLLSLMSYLTFQDVLRQRLEKLQALIGTLEKKAFDLVAKFDVKTNKRARISRRVLAQHCQRGSISIKSSSINYWPVLNS